MCAWGQEKKMNFYGQDLYEIQALSEIVQTFYKLMRDEDKLWNKLTPEEKEKLVINFRVLREGKTFYPDRYGL